MKKKLQILIVGLMIILLQTGCAKLEATMTIKNDGSIDYSYYIGIKKEYNPNGDPIMDTDQVKAYQKAGITVVEEEDDEYTGNRLNKKYDSIDELTSIADTSCELDIYNKKIDNMYCFTKEEGLFGEVYKAKIAVKPLKENINSSTQTQEDDNTQSSSIVSTDDVDNGDGTYTITNHYEDGSTYTFNSNHSSKETQDDIENMTSAIKSQLKATFVVKLPSKNLSNNATNTTDGGKVLTWDLLDDQMENVEYFEFSFNKPNTLRIIIASVLGAIIIFLVISIIISLIINRNNKPEKDDEPVETLDAPDTYTPVENTDKVNALLSPDGSDVNNLDKEN